jgi:putative transposase
VWHVAEWTTTKWPHFSTYPYTHVNMAYESVRRYGHKRTLELKANRAAKQTRRPKRVTGASKHPGFHRIQIDEHTVHAQNAVQLELDNRVIPLRLARATVLLAKHVDSTCVLGYQLVPTQHELLQLLDNCIHVWRPLHLSTPGLSYLFKPSGSCYF